MSLVSVNDGYGTRVGPKVFADVPTASEVRDAKRGRATFLLITLFLFGLLVAAGLVIGYLMSQDYPPQSRPGEVKELLADYERTLEEQGTEIQNYEFERRLYVGLMGAEGDADQAISRVNDLITQKEDAQGRTRNQQELWLAYERLRNRGWVTTQISAIESDTLKVRDLATRLEALTARAPTGSAPSSGGGLLPPCDPARQLCGGRRAP